MIIQTPLLRTTKAYGQLLGRDSNPLAELLLLRTSVPYYSVNSDTIVDLLIKLKKEYSNIPLTLIMDNARYQRCIKVTEQAKILDIDILFLPPYSHNLNLIERLWKFTKKKCLYNRYHETFCHFKAAIDDCIDKVKSVFKEQMKTLLNPKFQLFEKSAGVTA